MRTYFTFLDGAFTYDCASCGQACCRGKGAALDVRAELIPLLVRAPALAPLLTTGPGGLGGWVETADGCWFLADDGLCRIETSGKRADKPLTCRMFPFNRVFRAGTLRVVDFNSVICPLQDAEAIGKPGITHKEILADLTGAPDGPLTTSQAPLPVAADGLWDSLEPAISEKARDFLGRPAIDFLAWQAAACRAVVQKKSAASADPAPDVAELGALASSWGGFFGVDFAPRSDRAARHLALLSSSLRFNTLFRRGAPPYPVYARRMPKLLLATALLARVADGLAGRTSLRALTELHQSTAPQRELLSRWGDRAIVVTPPVLDAVPEPIGQAVHMAVARLQPFGGVARPLGEVLSETWAPLPPPLRALAFTVLARSNADLRFEEPAPDR